jgi:N-acetylmuramic acid 6-phosphate (MurNAc-6-P) etherase
MKDAKATIILMGFNEVERSGSLLIEGWNKSFYQVAKRLESRTGDGRHFILNPIVGPEPLTGSTRMKSGTATKILLDVLFGMLFHQSCNVPFQTSQQSFKPNHNLFLSAHFRDLFFCYEETIRETYYPIRQLASLVEKAGRALSTGSHVYYIGSESLGIFSIIDASECPPTFGAEFSDVRGFVVNGWSTLRNVSGDLSAVGSVYQLSHSDFLQWILPTLSQNDFVIFFLFEGQPLEPLLNCVISTKKICSNIRLICWPRHADSNLIETLTQNGLIESDDIVCVSLTHHFLLDNYPAFVETSTKVILNSISTGAHVLKGKVFKNRMIDLTISNSKLYHRALSLLQELGGVSAEESVDLLLRAIYQIDTVSEQVKTLPLSAHIEKATHRSKVLPLALLLASKKFKTVEEAQSSLQANPIVRSVVSNFSLSFQ